MIEKYIELKKKGLDPTLTLGEVTIPGGPEQGIILSWSRYDEDTGSLIASRTIGVTLSDFVAQAKRLRKLWLQSKAIYETLTGTEFPAND